MEIAGNGQLNRSNEIRVQARLCRSSYSTRNQSLRAAIQNGVKQEVSVNPINARSQDEDVLVHPSLLEITVILRDLSGLGSVLIY
jgi:hypothetical protein